jgi:hypothetical protein
MFNVLVAMAFVGWEKDRQCELGKRTYSLDEGRMNFNEKV